jgi:hypothetical protein
MNRCCVGVCNRIARPSQQVTQARRPPHRGRQQTQADVKRARNSFEHLISLTIEHLQQNKTHQLQMSIYQQARIMARCAIL